MGSGAFLFSNQKNFDHFSDFFLNFDFGLKLPFALLGQTRRVSLPGTRLLDGCCTCGRLLPSCLCPLCRSLGLPQRRGRLSWLLLVCTNSTGRPIRSGRLVVQLCIGACQCLAAACLCLPLLGPYEAVTAALWARVWLGSVIEVHACPVALSTESVSTT
jgi:hypothetical protein